MREWAGESCVWRMHKFQTELDFSDDVKEIKRVLSKNNFSRPAFPQRLKPTQIWDSYGPTGSRALPGHQLPTSPSTNC